MKNDTVKDLNNKKMDKKVYGLRRQVINLIYEAKKIVNLPRVTVRITDNDESTLGMGRLGKNIIWITEEAITMSQFNLRMLVWHELVHTVAGLGHIKDCPLMSPVHNSKITKTKADNLLKKYLTAGEMR